MRWHKERAVEILLTQNIIVNYGDDRGGVFEPRGAIVAPPRAVAVSLVLCGRALYANAKDDPTKGHLDTAPADVVKAARALAKQGAGGRAGAA